MDQKIGMIIVVTFIGGFFLGYFFSAPVEKTILVENPSPSPSASPSPSLSFFEEFARCRERDGRLQIWGNLLRSAYYYYGFATSGTPYVYEFSTIRGIRCERKTISEEFSHVNPFKSTAE